MLKLVRGRSPVLHDVKAPAIRSMQRLSLWMNDWRHFYYFAALTIVLDICLTAIHIFVFKYIEVDWRAYMEQMQGFLNGERDYLNLKGHSGPLVYPAGFVYLFSGLFYLTSGGTNIMAARLIFGGLETTLTILVLFVANRVRLTPPWVVLILAMSRRVHSIFAVELFNDCWAMTLAWVAIALFSYNKWTLGCVFLSLGTSVKMNVLLFAPAVGLLMWQSRGSARCFLNVGICLAIQVILATPFILKYPLSYVRKAFEFDRQFGYSETVNWRFLPEPVFQAPLFSQALLGVHGLLLTVMIYRWIGGVRGIIRIVQLFSAKIDLTPQYVVSTLLVCNFIGVFASRSIHLQFLTWYFHSLPILLWFARLPNAARFIAIVCIEAAYLGYPPSPFSAALLQVGHLILLVGLVARAIPRREAVVKKACESVSPIVNTEIPIPSPATYGVARKRQ
ncbi:Glycosyltransferase, ALG3 [Carpediemonas membranifera]|uniref:dolichyl-P-Man:Man5GlcNAc2-PP-dolichol alpha-1,3-mannosyltransferase n=1 Tax=Carpediemonas membranifera TaxID=201153 RepID=A0A8J6DY45_9EUKA|nr:Glycosyltransferase, ALG3 [Carpediemonas membranifera]|eukprot:KAG9391509.1 Glycosyltransferase, ALG3 [Carpediemonas membranifera]